MSPPPLLLLPWSRAVREAEGVCVCVCGGVVWGGQPEQMQSEVQWPRNALLSQGVTGRSSTEGSIRLGYTRRNYQEFHKLLEGHFKHGSAQPHRSQSWLFRRTL